MIIIIIIIIIIMIIVIIMKLAQKKQYYLKALFNSFQWNKHVLKSFSAQSIVLFVSQILP